MAVSGAGCVEPGPSSAKRRWSGLSNLADIHKDADLNADHVEEIGDVHALIRHGVITSSWAANHAFHCPDRQEMARIRSKIARRRDGACRLIAPPNLSEGPIDGLYNCAILR